METWDAYNGDGTLAGCDLIRGEPIPKGLRHLVCEVIVRHEDGSHLLMRRDLNKQGYPGRYEASAGGSALKGETAVQGALRELREETGISADILTHLYEVVTDNTIYSGFLCVTGYDKESVALQEGETIAYLWLSGEAFLQFVDSSEYIPELKKRQAGYLQSLNREPLWADA